LCRVSGLDAAVVNVANDALLARDLRCLCDYLCVLAI